MSVEESVLRTRPGLGIAIILGLLTLIGVGEIVSEQHDEDLGILVAIILLVLISGLLVAKRPEHPVSWLMAATALIGTLAAFTAATLPEGITELEWWQVPLAIVSGMTWYGLLLTMLVLIPLLFPTGSPTTPRWRWVGWLALSAFLLLSVLWMVQERFCTEYDRNDRCIASADNPVGISGVEDPERSLAGGVAFPLLIVCSLAALASLVIRYRRSRGVERRQIKWVLLSLGLFLLLTLAVDQVWVEWLGQPEPIGPVALVIDQLTWMLIPLSIALAILRYRLYDIDRIVSRTLSYALVVGLLGLVTLGLVSLFTLFLPSDDPLVVAISTLVVAALFNPLRNRVQRAVDRKFNRSRFDVERVVEGFAGRLQDRVDPEGVVDGWLGVVSETMQPESMSVWVRGGQGRDAGAEPKSMLVTPSERFPPT